MSAQELRTKFLEFFKNRGHKVIPSASLVPSEEVELAGTKRVLFTTAGMHPLVPFLLGQKHPVGKRLVNVQKSLRTDDIDQVGDAWHNTFFEMLGNWSLGDYWKKEAISWSYEFLTKELGLDPKKIYVTIFAGDSEISGIGADTESREIWKSLGISENRIHKLGKKDNWWGPVGETGPCGPDTEMFYDTGLPKHGRGCRPGETHLRQGFGGQACGKYAEIWNNVFMGYNKTTAGKYDPLKQKNVDTGMGIERTLAVLQGKSSVYETDVFKPLMEIVGGDKGKEKRIFVDHLRAAVMLISDGVEPSNKDRGYVLRRLIRRAIAKKGLEEPITAQVSQSFVETLALIYKEVYPEIGKKKKEITQILNKEIFGFKETLKVGLKEFDKAGPALSGKTAFDLYQSYGFPIELTLELATEKGWSVDRDGFGKEFKRHQEISKASTEKKFAGGLVDTSEITIRGHTATHLLHQALRDVLGNSVYQTGSNITPERIRFDFSHPEKLTPGQIKKVEEIVNKKIKENLPVRREIMDIDAAKKIGAIGLFNEKYGEKVSVYTVGPSTGSGQGAYSKEFCGGPHVQHTGEVGKFKIVKEEALGSGQRRIRAVLETVL